RHVPGEVEFRDERGVALHDLVERPIWAGSHGVQQQREVENVKRMLFAYRMLLLMVLASAGPLSLSAQEAQSRAASDFLDLERGVTEEELVTRALASNPTLLAQRQQIAMARGDVAQARLRQNPSLTLGGLKEVNGGDNAINVTGSLPLELFGRRASRTEVAENKEDATQQSVADQERLLSGEV